METKFSICVHSIVSHAFSRCHPSNFMVSGPTMRPRAVPLRRANYSAARAGYVLLPRCTEQL
jgi:hypothetical protein